MNGLPVLAEAVSISVLGTEHSLHANAMLIFTDLEQERVTDEAAYRTIYGLTPSEAKLAAILTGGRAMAEAAETCRSPAEPRASASRAFSRKRIPTGKANWSLCYRAFPRGSGHVGGP